MKTWKILARHKWVTGATITESLKLDSDGIFRRFTATIRGFQNWRIWQGSVGKLQNEEIIKRVNKIRDRIDANDESVFTEKGAW